jgi:hypothetical protein
VDVRWPDVAVESLRSYPSSGCLQEGPVGLWRGCTETIPLRTIRSETKSHSHPPSASHFFIAPTFP